MELNVWLPIITAVISVAGTYIITIKKCKIEFEHQLEIMKKEYELKEKELEKSIQNGVMENMLKDVTKDFVNSPDIKREIQKEMRKGFNKTFKKR